MWLETVENVIFHSHLGLQHNCGALTSRAYPSHPSQLNSSIHCGQSIGRRHYQKTRITFTPEPIVNIRKQNTYTKLDSSFSNRTTRKSVPSLPRDHSLSDRPPAHHRHGQTPLSPPSMPQPPPPPQQPAATITPRHLVAPLQAAWDRHVPPAHAHDSSVCHPVFFTPRLVRAVSQPSVHPSPAANPVAHGYVYHGLQQRVVVGTPKL